MKTSNTEYNGIKFTYFTNDMMASGSIGKNKEWEPHITTFMKTYNNLYTIENIIDVGANFGYHTIMFSREANGKVFAFEPQSQNYQLLKDNIQNNNISNVITFNLACGDEKCNVKMPFIEENNQMVNMGDFTPNMLENNNYTMTETIKLDQMTFPSKVDVIKIDVQGWEIKVLAGARRLLSEHKPVLIVEAEYFQMSRTNSTCEQLFNYIRDNNYHIFYLDYEYPSDHICIHNSNLDDFRIKFQKYIFPHTQSNHINNNIYYGVNEKIVMV
jgi:FkbM family methyltransferase